MKENLLPHGQDWTETGLGHGQAAHELEQVTLTAEESVSGDRAGGIEPISCALVALVGTLGNHEPSSDFVQNECCFKDGSGGAAWATGEAVCAFLTARARARVTQQRGHLRGSGR